MEPQRGGPTKALDANALELFARIAAAGSFAQAARELGLTRAAISRRVAALETQLGTPLFARTTRALGLTEAGRRLASRARAVLEAAETARRSFRRGSAQGADAGLAGTLRITSVAAFGESVLAPLLARFQRLHPALRIELRLTFRRMDLLRDDVDVAFRLTARPPPDWVAQPVLSMAVRAYAAPRPDLPLASPAALAGQPCLLFGPPVDEATLRWQAEGAAADAVEVTLEPALMADDLGTLVAVAKAGRGVVFLPDFLAARGLRDGSLIEALPGWRLRVPEGEQVHALTLPQPESSEAARELVRFVKAALAAPGPGPVQVPARRRT